MRIAYILGTESWGGLEMNQVRNALWMQERGHEVRVYGLAGSKSETFCAENGIPFQVIQKHKKYYDWKAAKVLAQLLKEHQTEHLILRDVRDMSVSVSAKRYAKKAFKVHYFMEMQLGVNKKNLLHTLRFKGLNTWSCPLKWLERQVFEKTRIDRKKVVCIPSALDTQQFTTAPSRAAARELLGLPADKKLFGLAGRFDPQKGQLMLLEAFVQLNRPDTELVFIGQATMNEGEEYVQHIQQFITENQIENRVHLLPFRKDTEVFYAAVDAFIMGSKCETVGMVTLEAMATGTMVIGSDAGGTREILQAGKLGYLFTPESSESLEEQLRLFLEKGYFVNDYELQQGVAEFEKERVMVLVENRLRNS